MTERQQPLCDRCVDRDNLARQNASLADEISGLLFQVRKLARENTDLKRQLNGTVSKEAENIKGLCRYHDEKYRAQFPRSKGLDYPMDGANAKAFRKALRSSCMVHKQRFEVEDIEHCIDGVFLSPFHTQKATYCAAPEFLENENKIRTHIQRWEAYDSLIRSGMRDELARRMIQDGVDRSALDANQEAAARLDADYAVIRAVREHRENPTHA